MPKIPGSRSNTSSVLELLSGTNLCLCTVLLVWPVKLGSCIKRWSLLVLYSILSTASWTRATKHVTFLSALLFEFFRQIWVTVFSLLTVKAMSFAENFESFIRSDKYFFKSRSQTSFVLKNYFSICLDFLPKNLNSRWEVSIVGGILNLRFKSYNF